MRRGLLEEDLNDVFGVGGRAGVEGGTGRSGGRGRVVGRVGGEEEGGEGVLGVVVELITDPLLDGGGCELAHQDVPVVEVGIPFPVREA